MGDFIFMRGTAWGVAGNYNTFNHVSNVVGGVSSVVPGAGDTIYIRTSSSDTPSTGISVPIGATGATAANVSNEATIGGGTINGTLTHRAYGGYNGPVTCNGDFIQGSGYSLFGWYLTLNGRLQADTWGANWLLSPNSAAYAAALAAAAAAQLATDRAAVAAKADKLLQGQSILSVDGTLPQSMVITPVGNFNPQTASPF